MDKTEWEIEGLAEEVRNCIDEIRSTKDPQGCLKLYEKASAILHRMALKKRTELLEGADREANVRREEEI